MKETIIEIRLKGIQDALEGLNSLIYNKKAEGNFSKELSCMELRQNERINLLASAILEKEIQGELCSETRKKLIELEK